MIIHCKTVPPPAWNLLAGLPVGICAEAQTRSPSDAPNGCSAMCRTAVDSCCGSANMAAALNFPCHALPPLGSSGSSLMRGGLKHQEMLPDSGSYNLGARGREASHVTWKRKEEEG